MDKELKPLLVTTDKDRRGVFFGWGVWKEGITEITLEKAQCVVYWDKETKGFLGLASDGPTDGCRITKAVPKLYLNGITSLAEVTSKAIQRFEAAPWSKN